MSERQEFHDNLNRYIGDRQIERLLASLVPRETRVNRDRLMFLAGQASTGPQKTRRRGLRPWMWPAATVCSACLGLFVGVFFGRVPVTPARPVAVSPSEKNGAVADQTEPDSFAHRTAAAPLNDKDLSFCLFSLKNRMLAAEREDPSRLADVSASVATASHPLSSLTYCQLLRQLLAERS